MRKKLLLSASLLTMLVAAMITSVYASTALYVCILSPEDTGAKGLKSNGNWVGEIPVKISNSTTPVYQTYVFCMDPDKGIGVGTNYPATLAPTTDNSMWRGISYVLTWYYPSDNAGTAAVQAAIWRLLDSSYSRPYWLEASIDNSGKDLANLASGKDVVRSNDTLVWISPISTNGSSIVAEAGDTVTFKARLTSSNGTPRANVRIWFNATITPPGTTLNSTYVSPFEAFTDSNGTVTVNVKVPADAEEASIIQVTASTKGVWPGNYIDIADSNIQNLIGVGPTFNLTTSTSTTVCIMGSILVLPESALGSLGAVVACAAAFVLISKFKRSNASKRS